MKYPEQPKIPEDAWETLANLQTMQEALTGAFPGVGKALTYRTSTDGASITCLVCNMTSYSRADVENLYCGKCHMFHRDRERP